MALEWQMVWEDVTDEGSVEEWLQKGFEPFAVSGKQLYLKRQVFTERAEPRSSAHPENENWAGKETTE